MDFKKSAEIDMDYLLSIAGQDSGIVLEILDDFENESNVHLDKIESYLQPVVNLEEIGKILHQLSGSSGSLGMISFREAILELASRDREQWKHAEPDLAYIRHSLKKSVELCKAALA